MNFYEPSENTPRTSLGADLTEKAHKPPARPSLPPEKPRQPWYEQSPLMYPTPPHYGGDWKIYCLVSFVLKLLMDIFLRT